MEGLSEKGKGLRDMDNSVVIVGGVYIRVLHGSGKNTVALNVNCFRCDNVIVIMLISKESLSFRDTF